MNFRHDINGLRAMAVVAVVLFHFNSDWVPGGFSGVDVFFVISGFLMTNIVFRGFENNTFSLFYFYEARAKRIIPALSILSISLIAFGWVILSSVDLRTLALHIVSSISFSSNIIYWLEAGYFDAASHEKWLLHTWSLSVEWQFYILYPVFLLVLNRFLCFKYIRIILLASTLICFVFGAYFSQIRPSAAYYLLPTRAWEMLVGGLVFLYPISLRDKYKEYLECCGIILILISFGFVSNDMTWPGYWALIPVLGTCFVISANRQNSKITNNILFQTLGKWSYSIYLWHWPIVTYLFFFEVKHFEVFGITLSLVIACISFNYIEKVRYSRKALLMLILTPLILASAILFKVDLLDYPERIIGHNYNNNGSRGFIGLDQDYLVNTTDESEIDFIGIGDSNLTHYAYGIRESEKTKILLAGSGSCFAFPDYTRKPYASWMDKSWLERCSNLYKRVSKYKNSDIIIAESWSPSVFICTSEQCSEDKEIYQYFSIVEQQLKKLSILAGKERMINVVGWLPAPDKSLVRCLRSEKCSGDIYTRPDIERVVVNSRLRKIASNIDNVHFIDVFESICDKENVCKTVEDSKNLFFDSGHLSAYGSLHIWSYIERNLVKGVDEAIISSDD